LEGHYADKCDAFEKTDLSDTKLTCLKSYLKINLGIPKFQNWQSSVGYVPTFTEHYNAPTDM
jgi:hypothetical protein